MKSAHVAEAAHGWPLCRCTLAEAGLSAWKHARLRRRSAGRTGGACARARRGGLRSRATPSPRLKHGADPAVFLSHARSITLFDGVLAEAGRPRRRRPCCRRRGARGPVCSGQALRRCARRRRRPGDCERHDRRSSIYGMVRKPSERQSRDTGGARATRFKRNQLKRQGKSPFAADRFNTKVVNRNAPELFPVMCLVKK